MERKMCMYCAKWGAKGGMTPLYEKDKDYVHYYCDGCVNSVKDNLWKLPYKHLFIWGAKGEM